MAVCNDTRNISIKETHRSFWPAGRANIANLQCPGSLCRGFPTPVWSLAAVALSQACCPALKSVSRVPWLLRMRHPMLQWSCPSCRHGGQSCQLAQSVPPSRRVVISATGPRSSSSEQADTSQLRPCGHKAASVTRWAWQRGNNNPPSNNHCCRTVPHTKIAPPVSC